MIKQRLRLRKLTRIVDLAEEIARRCAEADIPAPARRTVARRWKQALVERESDRPAPGTFRVKRALDVVQIDHTVSDVIVVDQLYRAPIGRPYLTVALDVATRSVLAAMLSFNAPSAATVAQCMTRIATSKHEWIRGLGLKSEWPMFGLPRSIHLDNAPEFHSQALLRGCAQFGIELIHRPAGRPHFGGHVERSIGTLMSRFKTLPGATGSSTKDRKVRRSEKVATMTLPELERWLVVEIADRYHHRPHRGLQGATPHDVWMANAPSLPAPALREALMGAFLPAVARKARPDGVHFSHIQYWHPRFAQWAVAGLTVPVHYDPRDLSKVFIRGEDGQLLEVGCADTTRPAVSLWECEAAARHLRSLGAIAIRESKLFEAIAQQREIVHRAAAKTRVARAKQARQPGTKATPDSAVADAGASVAEQPQANRDAEDRGYRGEIWP